MIPYAMERPDKEERGMGEREPRRCHRMVPERSLMVFSGRGNPELSARVAEKLGIELGEVDIKTFADGHRPPDQVLTALVRRQGGVGVGGGLQHRAPARAGPRPHDRSAQRLKPCVGPGPCGGPRRPSWEVCMFVEKSMTRKVITVRPETGVLEAHDLLERHRIRHLPVLKDDKVVGVISIGDVVTSLLHDKESLIKGLENYILVGVIEL